MSLDNNTSRAIVSSTSTSSASAPKPATRQVITTDQGEVEPPRYQSARGCLTIMGIMFACLMLMILYMYLFNEGR